MNANIEDQKEAPTQKAIIAGRSIAVRRLDLVHPTVNGNKWFKLKYNLEVAVQGGFDTLLTFGGAWSNHLVATARAGQLIGLKTIGIVRGEEPVQRSAALNDCNEYGMRLEFVSREVYGQKDSEDFKMWLKEEYGRVFIIPEGGSNYYGINGCMEIISKKDRENYDLICCACGTGSTMAGMMLSGGNRLNFLGFPAMKGGVFMFEQIRDHLQWYLGDKETAEELCTNLRIDDRWHFGGYGKWDNELAAFMSRFELENEIPLEQIYTGKMLYGLHEAIRNNEIPEAKRVLVIHTGGLQGRRSMRPSGA